MHDSVIAQSILKDLSQYGEIKKAYLEVGELFGIDPDHLLEHIKDVSDIEFEVEQTKSEVKCSECEYKGRAKIIERMHDFVLFECPKCGNNVNVISGDKIIISKVEK